MQQRMELFEGKLPESLQHRHNYGITLYTLGMVRMKAEGGGQFLEQVYHGIHNLDISEEVQAPHEMLLAMNPDEILGLYLGVWQTKMDEVAWQDAINAKDFWGVVRAVIAAADNTRTNRLAIARLGRSAASDQQSYKAGVRSLQSRLMQLPQRTATQFMTAFTHPFQATDQYASVKSLKQGLDEVVFAHCAGKFAEGERKISI